MNDIASKLALIVCEKCVRGEDENDIDFSTRLLSVYTSCYDNIEHIIAQKDKANYQEALNIFLDSN